MTCWTGLNSLLHQLLRTSAQCGGFVLKVRLLIAVISSAILISGCSTKPNLAGAAAVVGDVKISQAKVTDSVGAALAQIALLPPSTTTQLPTSTQITRMTIDRMVQDELFRVAALNPKYAVTEAAISKMREDVFAQYGQEAVETQIVTNNGVPANQINQFITNILVQNAIIKDLSPTGTQDEQSTALISYLSGLSTELNVRISPRYGEWSSDRLQSNQGGDRSLSVPLPVAQ